MKILHLLTSNKFSGAENVVCQIIDIFRDSQYQMIYCSPDGSFGKSLKDRDIEYYPLKKFSLREIKKAIVSLNPDIIHAHDMRATLWATMSAGKIPVISHIHNNGYDARKLTIKTLGFLWASIKIKHIFWVAQSAFQDYYFRKYIIDKSSVLPNIINIKAIESKSNEQINLNNYQYDFIFLGRLAYPKNPLRFVEVMKIVKEVIPNVKGAFIGEGNQMEETRNMVMKLGLDNNISFLGFITNPMPILKNAKALVMTSFWEGTPMCALESLSLGIPVLSTPVDGLKEIIINDYNGYLSDSNDDLANKLIKLCKDKEYYSKLSLNARSKSKEINDKNHYSNELTKIYNLFSKKN